MASPDRPDLNPYAGRWVALSQDGRHVAGSGTSAEQALALARRNRPKEKFTTRFVQPLPLDPLLTRLRPLLAGRGHPVYLVGGAVRDALLGRTSHDLDFVVPRDAVKLAFAVGDALGLPAYVLDRERDIGRVVLPDGDTTLDFARFRGDDLAADLRDRDFTLNAMALPAGAVVADDVIDPCDGRADLAAGVVRPTHAGAVTGDPVRALRAVRMALQFDLTLHADTVAQFPAAAARLADGVISAERIRDELFKLLLLDRPDAAVALLQTHGLLAAVLPAVDRLESVAQSPPHHAAVGRHTRDVLAWLVRVLGALPGTADDAPAANDALAADLTGLAPYADRLRNHLARAVDGAVSDDLLLRLGALFHDVGKADTQTVDADGRIRFIGHDDVGAALTDAALRGMRLSSAAVDHVCTIVAGHMRPLLLSRDDGVSRRAAYRYFRDCGSAGLDITLLALADHLATYDGHGPDDQWARLRAVVTALLGHYFDGYETTVKPPPLLSGRDVMRELGLPSGPEIGRILRALEEAQAAGDIHTRDDALALARRLPA